MPAFGKDGMVNLNETKVQEIWEVVKNGAIVKSCTSQTEAESYKGNLIASGVKMDEVSVVRKERRCI